MKVLRLAAILILAWVGIVFAQSWTVTAFDHESITVTYNTVSNLTTTTYQPTGAVPPVKRAMITVEDAHARYRADGTSPTISVGHLVKIDDVIVLETISDIKNFAIIGLSSTNTVVMVTYER